MSRTAYWIIGGVVVVLCVVGLIAYGNEKESDRAQEKAAELSQKLEQAGATVPDQDIIVRSLGDDGGAVCDNAEDGLDGLNKAILFDQLTNGASQVGRRPVIADRRLVVGQLLIVETYCPEHLEEFRDEFDDLKYDDVIGE
jgi:hypothetical protein